jgi:hypothetical protein
MGKGTRELRMGGKNNRISEIRMRGAGIRETEKQDRSDLPAGRQVPWYLISVQLFLIF